jgi:ParB-like chromosome segregation protein Spo0J
VRQVENGPLVILAGNHTHMALMEAGAKGARCEIIECDDPTARRINLVDNRSNDLATDDADALAELLAELGEDGAGSGWTQKEIDKMLEASAPAMPPTAPEEFTEYDEDIKTEHSCPKCGYEWSGGTK